MSSEAKVAANRRNAAKSTGPRTLVGKAIVAQNALKHGLFAHQDLIAEEDLQQYQEHCRRFLAELNPSGERQGLLAGRIVSLAWRLKRAERLQNELFDFLLARELESSLAGFADEMSEEDIERMRRKTETNPAYAVGRILARDYRGEKALDRLSLHEQRIEGSLHRTMKELDRVQSGRGDVGLRIAECGLRTEEQDRPCRESAKQSQSSDGWQRQAEATELADATRIVVGGPAEQSQIPHGPSCETKPICGAGARGSGNEVAGHGAIASSLVPAVSPLCQTPDGVATSGTDSAKQSQSRQADTCKVLRPRVRYAYHYHETTRQY